jgi:Ino eighty subunit 2
VILTAVLTFCPEVQVKKVFTAEEHAMRRAEMARRRRNLSDKRNEEVKVSTLQGPALS